MSNNFVTSDLISKEAAIHWANMDTFLATANRSYSEMWSNGTFDAGQTINIRLDNQFEVKRGDSVTPSDIVESTLPMTIKPLYSVPLKYNTVDLTTDLFQGWSERTLRPAVRNILSKINYDVATEGLTQVYHTAGAANTSINAFAAVEEPGTIMQELGVPLDDAWYFAMTPKDGSALKSALQNSFNDRLNRDISDRSALGYLSYFDMYFDQGINTQSVTSTKGAGPFSINANVASGATTVQIAGLTATTGTINAGEVFQVTGIQSVNHINKTATGRTMQFVVTADATADGAGVATVSVAPAIYGPELHELQNVTALPVAADVVTFVDNAQSSYKVNYAYGANALHIATPPLAPFDSPFSSVYTDNETGISLRVSKTAEVMDNMNVMRLDVLCAYRWIGSQAVRVHSQV